jgi:hypothetical protein
MCANNSDRLRYDTLLRVAACLTEPNRRAVAAAVARVDPDDSSGLAGLICRIMTGEHSRYDELRKRVGPRHRHTGAAAMVHDAFTHSVRTIIFGAEK